MKFIAIILAAAAVFLKGSNALICYECRTALDPNNAQAPDYCSEPHTGQLVACPIAQQQCYTTLGLIGSQLIFSRGCGRAPSLPASVDVPPGTCRAYSDQSATVAYCSCATNRGCNFENASSNTVMDALRSAVPTPTAANANDANVNNNVDRQARIITPSSQTVVVVGPVPQVVAVATTTTTVTPDTTTTTTTTTTTEAPSSTTVFVPRIIVQVPNGNTQNVQIVDRTNGNNNVVVDATTTTETPPQSIATIYPPLQRQQEVIIVNSNAQPNNVQQSTSTSAPLAADQIPDKSTGPVVVSATTQASTVVVNTNGNNNNNATRIFVVTNSDQNNNALNDSDMASRLRQQQHRDMMTEATTVIAVVGNVTVSRTVPANNAAVSLTSSSMVMLVIALVSSKIFC